MSKKRNFLRFFLVGWLVVFFGQLPGICSGEGLPPEYKAKVLNEAFASCFTQIAEQTSGFPASGIAQMAGYFSAGDYSDGLLAIAKLGGDAFVGEIPVIGQVKFVLGLEDSVIKVGKMYIDDYLTTAAWKIFKGMDAADQRKFVVGNADNELDDYLVGASGGYYLSRNVRDLRKLFGTYLEQEQKKSLYMQKTKEILVDLHKAEYFLAPEPVSPIDKTLKYNAGIELSWWAYSANFFKVFLSVNGENYQIIKKLNPYNYEAAVKLGDFGIDWNRLFQEAEGEPLHVQWHIKSACYDADGLVSALIGSQYVIGNEKLLSLPTVDQQDRIKDGPVKSFTLVSPQQLRVSIQSPADGAEVSENSVTVTASVASDENDFLSTIDKVGFIINGGVQYASLDGASFSTVAVLATGDNSIQAGVVTKNGMVILSRKITVKSTADHNTYHIRIAWDKDDTDVDVHFAWSGGSTCYYNNKTPDWGGADVSPALDVDNTHGYGPENITINALPGAGHYKIYVHYFSDHDNGGTTVIATIDKNGTPIVHQSRYMSDGESWTLLEFDL